MTAFTNPPTSGKQFNVLAPGVSIVSLRDPGSGTSQATAVTSAAAALLLQARPTATPEQVKDWLVRSATYLPTGLAADLGLKEINVNAALARSSTLVQPQVWTKSIGTGTLDNARGSSRVMLDNAPLSQPLIHLDQRLRPEGVDAALCILANVDQSHLPQHPQVPGHPRAGDRKCRRELAGRRRMTAEELEHRAPARVGQRLQHRIHSAHERNRTGT